MQQPLPFHNLYVGIIECLEEIFVQSGYTDKVLEKKFKQNRRWGSRDRGFVAESVYDMVRWKRWIDFASGGALKRKDWWGFVGTWFVMNDLSLPDFREFQSLNYDKIKKSSLEGLKLPVVKYSLSQELYDLGLNELGDQWHPVLEALNETAPAILRVNTLKASKKEVIKQLKDEGIETRSIEGYPDALEVKDRANLFSTEAFSNGLFEMQDASSQLVASFVDPQPGMRIADSCAGAGGKSLHLATLMENKGTIISMDLFEWKLKELKRRAKRNGVHNVQMKVIESTKTIKRLKGNFDKVLIDAPCSGSGILKRNPDAKWKIDADFLQRVKTTQREILQLHKVMVKPGGELIYATCSVFPSENQQQVEGFLAENPDFELKEEKVILPNESGYDGFYMAKMIRKA